MKDTTVKITRAAEILSSLLLRDLTGRRRQRGGRLSARRREDLRRASAWSWEQNIVGLAVGEKTAGGKREGGRICLKFYVRHKRPKSRLLSRECIPEYISMETLRAEVLTDVEAVGAIPVTQAHDRVRPLQGGTSLGHYRGESGTLGLIVRRRGSDRPLALTCSHVAAICGYGQPGDPVEQPADPDGAVGPNKVGTLSCWFSRLRTDEINTVDAALVQLDEGIEADKNIREVCAPNGSWQLNPDQLSQLSGLALIRSGAGTGKQGGTLESVKGFLRIRVPQLNDAVVRLGPVAIYRTACAAGDSGAAVLEASGQRVVGLHVGGWPEQDRGIFTPIQLVFDSLKIELL